MRDGALHTPTNDCLLEGITYDTVIKLAKKRGIAVHQRDIYPSEMAHFQGCFVVGTAAEVTPVREIQGIHYEVGETIRALASDYDQLVRGQISL